MKLWRDGGSDGSALPVFRLVAGDGDMAPEFFWQVAAETARRGRRLLLLHLAGDSLRRSGPGPTDDFLPPSGIDRLDLCAASFSPVSSFSSEVQCLALLADLCQRYDMILVSGSPALRLNTLVVAAGAGGGREGGGHVRTIDPLRGAEGCAAILSEWAAELWQLAPVWACVLIGGRSSRMGRPKHLLTTGRGDSWLEATVAALQPRVDGVVLSGAGLVPEALAGLPRMADVPGAAGPLAGILSAMRWLPGVSWLLAACDMPSLTPEAIDWLLDSRDPGRWAVIPRRHPDSHVEPLLAWYDRRCRPWFEELLLSGSLRIGEVACHPQAYLPVIPEGLRQAWDNVNTPQELARLVDAVGSQAGQGGHRPFKEQPDGN